jgi:carboxypeptidase A1
MINADAFFNDYRRYDDIITFYKQRAAPYASLVVKTVVIGKSIEGRDIYAFHLRGRASGAKKLYWEGGIHAREWISPPTVAFQFEQLLSLYGSDADATFILDTFEVVIVPVVNPDGYEYSHTRDRLWRTNRRVNSGSTCAGVDLNRTWEANWAQGGSSNSPCSDTYHGTAPFSEPESRVISSYFLSLGKIDAAIDFHSYSQLILRPYGYTRVNAPDEANLKALGDGMRDAILPVHGKAYTSQKSIDLYVTTGTASDWFYIGTNNYSWGYTIELRDTGRYGFVLPADQIVPQGEEIWAAMKYFAKYVAANHA